MLTVETPQPPLREDPSDEIFYGIYVGAMAEHPTLQTDETPSKQLPRNPAFETTAFDPFFDELTG